MLEQPDVSKSIRIRLQITIY